MLIYPSMLMKRKFSPPFSSAHRFLQCHHSQWEVGEAAIPGEFPLAPRHYRAISQWACILEWRHAGTLHILVGKICIIFFLFYCEGMLSLVGSIMTLWMEPMTMIFSYMLIAMVENSIHTVRLTPTYEYECSW